MGVINSCLDCISSCCILEVFITKEDSETLTKIDLNESFTTSTDAFIKENPKFEKRREFLDNMYNDSKLQQYAKMNKNEDGYCVLLNRETRLCSIYENRPQVCKDFSDKSKRCKKIRKCIV